MPCNERNIERKIVRKLLALAKSNGLILEGIDDSVQFHENLNTTSALELLFDLDEARVFFLDHGDSYGVYLVFGNDGWDVVSDYHVAPAGSAFARTLDALNTYSDKFID